jgi:hypothetical protein
MYSNNTFGKYPKEGLKIFLFFLSVALIYIVIVYPLKRKRLVRHAKYTVGMVIDRTYIKGSYDPVYVYDVNQIHYTGTEANIIQGPKNFSAEDIGKKYVVLYDSTAPKSACLLHKNPIADTVTVPLNGWDEIPANLLK